MATFVFVSVLIIITCILLVLIVLVQNSKGGGLASNFASSNQFMGVRKTADFLEKSTWTLAVALLVFSLVSVFVIPKAQTEEGDLTRQIEQQSETQSFEQEPIMDYEAPPVEQTPAEGAEQKPE